MVNRNVITKFSIALAVICAVICVVSIAPLAVALVFALVTLLCLVCCLLIYIVGGIVWLLSVGQANIFRYATALADFGLGLFNFITPIAQFSFHYLTPIAGGVALFVGIVGIVVSSVGISKAKEDAQLQLQSVPEEADLAQEEGDGKKKKAKKKKTNRGACVASLIVCSVFSAVAFAAIVVALVVTRMF